jgi:hypothetical protein
MSYTGFFFEANSIQSYILQGGRLRDIVGGSFLLDQLCSSDINSACRQLGLTEVLHEPQQEQQILFTRKASGAIYAVLASAEAAQALAALWSLWVRQRCPGLSFNQALSTGATVFQVIAEGSLALGQARSLPPPALPAAAPMVERSPRTGLAAVHQSHALGKRELVDSAVAARRSVLRLAQTDTQHKLIPALDDGKRCVFPVNLEFEPQVETDEYRFPFLASNRSVGILHADANGLGQVLLAVIAAAEKDPAHAGQHFPAFLARLSNCVANATESAGKQAVASVLVPKATLAHANNVRVLPARPILLAGDDLTIILRADIAFDFLTVFSSAFEDETRRSFAKLGTEDCARPFKNQLPAGLTMCAGLQFVRNNFPFAQALHLAEDLCSAAKTQAKALQHKHGLQFTPAAVCFHRMTTSMVDDASAQALPGLGAYSLRSGGEQQGVTDMPDLQALLELASALAEGGQISAGPMRRLLNVATTDPSEALADYRRWRQLSEKSAPAALNAFDHLMARVHPAIHPDLFPGLTQGVLAQHDQWVLPDLLHLLATQTTPSGTSAIKE